MRFVILFCGKVSIFDCWIDVSFHVVPVVSDISLLILSQQKNPSRFQLLFMSSALTERYTRVLPGKLT